MKYCGGGYGGYSMYIFYNNKDRDKFVSSTPSSLKIEPYINEI